MKKGLILIVVLILFAGVALLAGCGGSGSAPSSTAITADRASDTGLANGLSVACLNPVVAAKNPNCCDPDDIKCGLGRASATGLLKGVCGACANNPVVAASNPNCALCCDPDDVKCP